LALLFGCRGARSPAGDEGQASTQQREADEASQERQRELAAVTTAELIDSLIHLTADEHAVRSNIIGVGEIGQGQGELPEGLIMMQDSGPTPSEAMQELVRRGAQAVPELVAHLSDARPTKVPVPTMMSQWFGYEYDYNTNTTDAPPSVNPPLEDVVGPQTTPAVPKVFAVGDICFDLLGQIVNRRFESVRYQPTLCIVINSPRLLEPLRGAAVREWGDLTPETHRQRLMDDVAHPDSPWREDGARELLARYYPDVQLPSQ